MKLLSKPASFLLLLTMALLLSSFSTESVRKATATTGTQALLSALEYHHSGTSTINSPLSIPAVCINGCSFQGSGNSGTGDDVFSATLLKNKPGEHLYRIAGISIHPYSTGLARRYLAFKVIRI